MAITENLEQVISTSAEPIANMSMLSLIMSADLVGKLVILILALTSIWSWAIIIDKFRLYVSTKKRMQNFEKLFWSGRTLDTLYNEVKQRSDNPLSDIFVNTINECRKNNISERKSDFIKTGNKERMLNLMHVIKNRNIELLESKLSFLATAGSAAPFIGLFGTVWGIMHSFQSIASSKNTTLAVVAPGIAEALLATAIGLFVAIPATIFYNYLTSEVDDIYRSSENFIGELNNLISRAIDEEKM